MSILLIRPPFLQTGFDQQFQEPLNLCYLAAVLRRDGFDVRLLDAEFSEMSSEQILEEVAGDGPTLIGLSVMSEGALAGTMEICDGLRRWAAPNAHVTVGGHFATFNTEYLLRMAPEIDSAVLFEGENVISELARHVVGKTGDWRLTPGIAYLSDGPGSGLRRTAPAPPLLDLDDLPPPARDLLPKAIQLGLSPAVLSSRGCSGRCSFCTIHSFMRHSSGTAWRGRSGENVLAEIRMLTENFRVGEIGFLDDDYIGTRNAGRTRAADIAERILRAKLDIIYNIECRPDMIERDLFAKLRDSGLRSVFVGVESVSANAIRVFNKGTSRDVACRAMDTLADLGLDADVGFILYHPYATLEEIREGYAFLKRYGQLDVHTALNRLFIAPGAPIRERLIAEGRLRDVASPTAMGNEEYEYADPRVGVLLAVLRVAVFPIFPGWYHALKEFRRLRAERKFHEDARAIDERMARLQRFDTDVCHVVEGCFEEAYVYADTGGQPDTDMLGFSRRLMRQARDAVASAAETTSCTDCLTDTGEGGQAP